MECLTPPLDSVPVEEWFCPECEATNRRSSKPSSLPKFNIFVELLFIFVAPTK